MNISYLYSIVELYLKKENDEKKTNLSIIKTDNNKIQFNFNMNKIDSEITSFWLPVEKVFENNNFYRLMKDYKQNLIIIDEKYNCDNQNSCYYYILLNNGRSISFKNFSIIDINSIRNIIYDIKFQKEEIRIKFEDDKEENNTKYYFRLQRTGFASLKTICVVGICFLIVFVLSLWVFKTFVG